MPDLLIDLHDYYGAAFPRPRGSVVDFTVIKPDSTYEQAKAEIEQILAKHGLLASRLTITPGPENKKIWSRRIVISVARDLLM